MLNAVSASQYTGGHFCGTADPPLQTGGNGVSRWSGQGFLSIEAERNQQTPIPNMQTWLQQMSLLLLCAAAVGCVP